MEFTKNFNWKVTGNDLTNSAVNFLGTTDSTGLSLRTDNAEAIHIDSLQNVSIGTNNTDISLKRLVHSEFTMIVLI